MKKYFKIFMWMLLVLSAAGIAVAAQQVLAPTQQSQTSAAAYINDPNSVLSRVMESFPVIEGMVVGLQGDLIYVDLGENKKSMPGLELRVYRVGEDFKHPVTGEVLGKLEKDLGIIKIKEVREKFSVAETVQKIEGEKIAVGDKVRISTARIILAVGLTQEEGTTADLRSISRQLQTALTRANRFEIIDEGRLKNAMAQLGVGGFENLADPTVAKKLEKSLRVQAVLVGRIVKTTTVEYLDIKITSAMSGEVLSSFSVDLAASAPRTTYLPPGAAAGSAPYLQGAAISTPGSLQGPAAASIPNPEFVVPGPNERRSTWKTPDFDRPMGAMLVADVNGDGKNEVVLADESKVYVFAWEGNVFRQLWASEGGWGDKLLALDAVDLKGTGIPQIVVTNMGGSRLASFILEYDKKTKKFNKILDNEPYFFRALPTGEGGKDQLYGQMMNISTQMLSTGTKVISQEPFKGSIQQMVWRDNKLEKGATLPAPAGAGIYGVTVADIDGDGAKEIITIDDNDYLRVYSMEGKLKWKSSDNFGGSALFFRFNAFGTLTGEKSLQAYIKGRILVRDWEKKGRMNVVVPKNVPKIGYFLENSRLYDKGKISNLSWHLNGLETVWETKELQGVITDLALADIDGDGVEDLVVLMLYPSYLDWNLLPWVKGTSTVLFYKLAPPAGSATTAK